MELRGQDSVAALLGAGWEGSERSSKQTAFQRAVPCMSVLRRASFTLYLEIIFTFTRRVTNIAVFARFNNFAPLLCIKAFLEFQSPVWILL